MAKRAPLGLLFAVVFLDLLAFGIVIPQLGVYAKLYGASGATQGLIIAAYSMMQFLCAPLLGRWSDRVGRKPVLMVSVAAAAVGHVLFAFAGGIGGLLAARLVNGVGGANISVAQAAIADATPPERRTKAMGLVGAAFGLGFMLGPAIGGAMGHWGTSRWGTAGGNLAIGLTAASFSLACLVLMAVRLPETLAPAAEPRPARKLRLLDLATLRESFRQPVLARLMLVFLVSTAGFTVLHAVMSYFVIDTLGLRVQGPEGVAAAQHATAVVFAYIGLIAVLIQGGAIGRLARRHGEAPLLRWGLLLMAVGLALQPLAASLAAILALCSFQAGGNALATASAPALVSFHCPPERRGEVLGVFHSLGSLGRIGGPLCGGWLYDLGRPVPFVVGAVLCAVAAVIAWPVPNHRPGASEAPSAPVEDLA